MRCGMIGTVAVERGHNLWGRCRPAASAAVEVLQEPAPVLWTVASPNDGRGFEGNVVLGAGAGGLIS